MESVQRIKHLKRIVFEKKCEGKMYDVKSGVPKVISIESYEISIWI